MDETILQIKRAEESDVSGILDVQQKCLSSHQRNQGATDSDLSRNGFLVFPIERDEFVEIIRADNRHFFYVAEYQREIQGYILAYDLEDWIKIEPSFENIVINDQEIANELHTEKTLYLRHIATRSDLKGVGQMLEDQLISDAEKRGYRYIIAEVAKLPIPNNRSMNFHIKNGFKEIGEEPEEKYVWSIIRKDVQGNSQN